MNVCVLGAGAWGTALARILSLNGHHVTLWGHDASHLDEIQEARVNERYLPGVHLGDCLHFESNLAKAAAEKQCIVLAVPSKAFRATASNLPTQSALLASVTKGIEFESGKTMCEVLAELHPESAAIALSGPTLAAEVARDVPAAIVAASDRDEAAQAAQKLFHRPTFRVYTSRDVRGVELGGA